METEPSIHAACLAAYNNGSLHGARMDAAREPWAIYNDIVRMLKSSPIAGADEWAIHDYGSFEGVRISEHAGIESVSCIFELSFQKRDAP